MLYHIIFWGMMAFCAILVWACWDDDSNLMNPKNWGGGGSFF